MTSLVATGHPYWPPAASSWDWWPLAGVLLFLFIVKYVLRARLRPWMIGVALAAGPSYSLAIDTWGVVPTTSVVLFAAVVLASLLRHPRTS